MNLLTHCGLVMPYGIITWSILVQLMACCLTAPSHHLNRCWLITSEVLQQSSEDSSQDILKISILDVSLEIYNLRLPPHIPGKNELTYLYHFCSSVISSPCWSVATLWKWTPPVIWISSSLRHKSSSVWTSLTPIWQPSSDWPTPVTPTLYTGISLLKI